MHADLIVSLGSDDDRTFHVEPMQSADEARRWLDDQFIALGCEPRRPSGKVLTADKVLAVAESAGEEMFGNAEWADAFARAAAAALGRSPVRVDVLAWSVNY